MSVPPHEPRSMVAHRARFGWSVDHVHDCAAVAAGLQVAEGTEPEHRFDFFDGLRLIVSRQRLTGGRVVRHVSASVAPGTALHAEWRSGWCDARELERRGWSRYVDLSRDRRAPPVPRYLDGRGIPHWICGEGEPGGPGAAEGGPS